MPDSDPHLLDPAATDETSANARDGARKRRDPNQPAAVIGIGASAGGIAPLQQFFSDTPPDTGLAFVVVMHLSPDFESQLAGVIQQKTSMPVTQVSEPVKVLPNSVYVIPPSNQLTFEDSMLRLVPPQQGIGRRVTIDLFFRTLAQAYGQRAVCVILSGTDSDGVIGLKHIRAQGGLTIVQDPNEAEFDSMPATAISTGMVDWVLPVGEMSNKLVEFVRNENRMKLPPEIPEADEPDVKVDEAPGGETVSDETRSTEDEEAIVKVLADVRAQTGHDFSHYKRATVLRRIARRLQVNSLETIPQYLGFLRTHPAEARALLQDLLIGVTHFFRDREAFAALEAHIPQLFAGKKKSDEIRVWVAGCASGEEAYSIAMLLTEQAARLNNNAPSVQVFATDLDEEAIADARDGLFPSMIEADVSPERLRAFFVRDHGRYRVRKEIREKVLFASHNLLADAPFSRCDMVSCRNLLIYLNGHAQKQVFDVFHFSLRAGGMLFLGGAENHSQAQSLFSPVDAKHRIFVRRSTPRPTWQIPVIPLRAADPQARRPTGWRSRPLPALTHDVAERAGSGDVGPSHAGTTRREVLFGELHLRLLEQYGPPSVVVNDAHDIVHLSGSASRYLKFIAGEPTANIAKVVVPELQIEMRTALFKAAQLGERVRSAPMRVDFEGKSEVIVLEVRPMRAEDAAAGFYLVLFEKQSDAPLPPAAMTPAAGISREADDEIQFLKQQLAATVEQYEASNEELKASNEELQAMNEEMRSATEELQTSKEELQSVNEELTTVNHELKANVEELSHTNADLNNLMASTDVGTIFLDRSLSIHRFTPAAQKVFNLIAADIGRPISDITSSLKYEGFVQDAESVLRDLVTIEREVRVGENDSWFLTRIAPYRTSEDRIAGVVATFIDISQRKKAEDELRESEERMRRAFAIRTVGIIYFTADGRISDANEAFLTMSGYSRTDLEAGRVRWDALTPDEFMPASLHAVEEFKTKGHTTAYEKQYIRKDGSRFWALFAATRLNGDEGVEFIVDISDKKEIEQALRESEERFRTVADNVPQLIWTNNAEGYANYFNRRWYKYSGLTYEESAGGGWQNMVHPDDEAGSVNRWQEALRKGEVFDSEFRLRNGNGDYRWFIGRNVPLRSNGTVLSWFGSATDIEDLKRAQARLGETEEKFRLLVEGTPDYAMFLLDPENNITYWSAGAQRVFGWTAEEAIGRKGSMIFTDQDLEKRADHEELAQALRDGSAADRRWHRRKDDTQLWLDGFMRRLNHKNGELRGFAKIAREATDQKIAEEKLRQAHDELEQRVHHRTKELQAMNETLEQEMERRRRLESEILQVTERERARISQDLHDSLCQELTATAFLMKSRARSLGRTDPEAAEALTEAAQAVNKNAGLARDLARGLHPLDLGPGGLVAALRELASRTSQTVTCKCECPRTLRLPSEAVALNLYRIAQEAVTNALKHGKPTEVVICIERLGDEVHLVVTDDGTPKRHKKGGLGIQMMQYRASVSGGTLEISSRKGKGTRVACRVPVK